MAYSGADCVARGTPAREGSWQRFRRRLRGLNKASRTQPRGSHHFCEDGGCYGGVSAVSAQPEAAGILLGADFDDCDPALHHQSC